MSPLFLRSLTLVFAVFAAALASAVPALARGGPGRSGGQPEVRVAGKCGNGATSTLRVRARDGGLETEFKVWGRSSARWTVTLVHERQIAWRGHRRTAGVSHYFNFGYRLPDFSGADAVSARAVGPRGVACWASATLPG
jgi:hypothetical protein